MSGIIPECFLHSKNGYKLVKCPVDRNGGVKIADGTVSVEPRAFENSKIFAVEFPDSLQDVRNKAFSNCKNLEHVNFGHGIQRIGSSSRCFQSCHKLKRIEFPEQVRNIGEKSFMNCGLEEVIFHEGLMSICVVVLTKTYAFNIRCHINISASINV